MFHYRCLTVSLCTFSGDILSEKRLLPIWQTKICPDCTDISRGIERDHWHAMDSYVIVPLSKIDFMNYKKPLLGRQVQLLRLSLMYVMCVFNFFGLIKSFKLIIPNCHFSSLFFYSKLKLLDFFIKVLLIWNFP